MIIDIYNTATEVILRTVSCPDGHAAIQCQAGEGYVDHVAGANMVVNGVATYVAPTTIPPSVASVQAARLNNLTNEMNAILANGYMTQNLPTNFCVNSTRDDLQNFQLALVFAQNNNLTTLNVPDHFGVMQQNITLADLQDMINELIAYGMGLFAQMWQMQTEINAATTPAQVAAISWGAAAQTPTTTTTTPAPTTTTTTAAPSP